MAGHVSFNMIYHNRMNYIKSKKGMVVSKHYTYYRNLLTKVTLKKLKFILFLLFFYGISVLSSDTEKAMPETCDQAFSSFSTMAIIHKKAHDGTLYPSTD